MGLKQGPMSLADIELLLIEAAKLSNHRNFVIAGSLSVLGAVMRAHPKVMAEPAPSVTIVKLNLEGVELAVRPHCDPKDYWDVYFDVYEQGLAALQANGIAGPQPTMHLMTSEKA